MKELKMEEKFHLDSMIVSCVGALKFKAVQVTDENMELVAKWCDGWIERDVPLDAPEIAYYIEVNSRDRKLKPFKDRAYSGDWIVMDEHGVGYPSVYSTGAYENLFELSPVATQSPNQFRRAAGITQMYEEAVKDSCMTPEEFLKQAYGTGTTEEPPDIVSEKYDEIHGRTVELVLNAMEYQHGITMRGGVLDEGHAVAEFVGLSVRRMIET